MDPSNPGDDALWGDEPETRSSIQTSRSNLVATAVRAGSLGGAR